MLLVTTTVSVIDEHGIAEITRTATHCDLGAVVQCIAQNAEDAIAAFHDAEGLL
jgi:hypothetical protein